jgi:hypothetical protein
LYPVSQTGISAQWLKPTMYTFMSLQTTLPTEWLITQLAAKWPLPTVYTQMYLQRALLTEWLITYNTAKWPLPNMYWIELNWIEFIYIP